MMEGFQFIISLTGLSRLNIRQDGWRELQDLLTKLVSLCRISHSCTFIPQEVIQGSGGGVNFIFILGIFRYISNKMQHYTVYLFLENCSTYFEWYFHPSSGTHTTVFTASGNCQTVTATCRYRGLFQLFHNREANICKFRGEKQVNG
jgi:hypothetical protein